VETDQVGAKENNTAGLVRVKRVNFSMSALSLLCPR
jgi:hypothetical protein